MRNKVDYSKRDTRKDFLSAKEMDQFLKAWRKMRHPARNYCMALLCFRHGFRVSELITVRLEDVNFDEATLSVYRLKNGLSTVHPLMGDEVRAIKAYVRTRDSGHPNLFISQRGPFTRSAINYLFSEIGKLAKLPFHVHPHMLRHSTGYQLANKGMDLRLIQDYLGHRDVQSTVRYTRVNPARFKNMWR